MSKSVNIAEAAFTIPVEKMARLENWNKNCNDYISLILKDQEETMEHWYYQGASDAFRDVLLLLKDESGEAVKGTTSVNAPITLKTIIAVAYIGAGAYVTYRAAKWYYRKNLHKNVVRSTVVKDEEK